MADAVVDNIQCLTIPLKLSKDKGPSQTLVIDVVMEHSLREKKNPCVNSISVHDDRHKIVRLLSTLIQWSRALCMEVKR